jgi:hypothetical protein
VVKLSNGRLLINGGLLTLITNQYCSMQIAQKMVRRSTGPTVADSLDPACDDGLVINESHDQPVACCCRVRL